MLLHVGSRDYSSWWIQIRMRTRYSVSLATNFHLVTNSICAMTRLVTFIFLVFIQKLERNSPSDCYCRPVLIFRQRNRFRFRFRLIVINFQASDINNDRLLRDCEFDF